MAARKVSRRELDIEKEVAEKTKQLSPPNPEILTVFKGVDTPAPAGGKKAKSFLNFKTF